MIVDDKSGAHKPRTLFEKILHKVEETKVGKELKDTEEYNQIKGFKEDMKRFVDILKEDVKANVNISISSMIPDSKIAEATMIMRKYDPGFTLFNFEDEIEAVFKRVYTAFLNKDSDYLKATCGDVTLAFFEIMFKHMKETGTEPYAKEALFFSKPAFITVNVSDSMNPEFIFSVSVQEVDCMISTKKEDAGKIVEGDPDNIQRKQFTFVVVRHPSPDLSVSGHYWQIKLLEQAEVLKQIL